MIAVSHLSPTPETSSIKLKEAGNEAYRSGRYEDALTLFSSAIQLDPKNETLYCNRSMCHAALLDWRNSAFDAKESIALSEKYVKAHYRLVKAQLELQTFRDARLNLLHAFRLCGETKELKNLESEILVKTKIPLRPRSTDFEVVHDLGEGNFSKIFKVSLKSTGDIYAMKVIDKLNAKRMERRHKNINNEIMMEKRVLNKLSHPNIVIMYGTFQDEGSLYYHMEFLAGGELWGLTREKDEKSGLYSMVGVHWSLTRFYMAELINALEYMHKRGIVHRDIKPENILLTAEGHIKIIDFGTAKDLLQTDLNGPDFVGTSEYMSPSTVNGKPTGAEGDLWALGVVLFQCITGCTAFYAASPYLVFLMIKRALVRYPSYAPRETNQLIQLLLEKNGPQRLMNALGPKYADFAEISETTENTESAENAEKVGNGENDENSIERKGKAFKPVVISYDYLRGLDYFKLGTSGDGGDMLGTVEGISTAHTRAAVRVPLLSEISLRAVGNASVYLSELVAQNGGTRPDIKWMQAFDLQRLSKKDLGRIAHYLNRKHRLHVPGTHRLFFPSAVAARCNRVDWTTIEYIGHGRDAHGQFDKPFFFAYLSDPLFGYHASTTAVATKDATNGTTNEMLPVTVSSMTAPPASAAVATTTAAGVASLTAAIVTAIADASVAVAAVADTAIAATAAKATAAAVADQSTEPEMDNLRKAVSAINKLRPRFLVVSGSFTHSYPLAAPLSSSASHSSSHTSSSFSSSSSIPSSSYSSSPLLLEKTPSVPLGPGSMGPEFESLREQEVKKFMRSIARVSETIPLLFVPGDRDVGEYPTPYSLSSYNALFGRDFYGFWYGGLRILVVNSPLLIHPENASLEAALQVDWLEEEIEQAKLCSGHMMLFSAHPWFLRDILEENEETSDGAPVRTVPISVRVPWLKRLRHSKVRFLFSGGAYSEGFLPPNIAPHAVTVTMISGDGNSCSADNSSSSSSSSSGTSSSSNSINNNNNNNDTSIKPPPQHGELHVQTQLCASFKSLESRRKPFPKGTYPAPPPPTDEPEEETEKAMKKREKREKRERKEGIVRAKEERKEAKLREREARDVEREGKGRVQVEDEEEDIDIEIDIEGEEEEEVKDESSDDDTDDDEKEGEKEEKEDEEWVNQDETYEGPVMVITAPIGLPLNKYHMVTEGKEGKEGKDVKEDLKGPGIRIIKVYEQSTTQHFYALDFIPKAVTLDKV